MMFLFLHALFAIAVTTDNAAQVSQNWLVILASAKDSKQQPESIETLHKHPEIPTQLMLLSSTEFKGLMPCYYITIANAFPEKADAMAYSQKLKSLNIDHYILHSALLECKNPVNNSL